MKRYGPALLAALTLVGTGGWVVSARARSSASACESYQPVLDPSHFVPTIDNPYFPLPVGRVLVYRGGQEGEKQIDTVTVTDTTKVIEGITATVVLDVATERGRPIERTRDWYAQDDEGTVWYLGEATKEFLANGGVDTSGSWEAGVDGAKPGIVMEANPQIPDAYRQECLDGEALDTAWVVSRGGSVSTPFGRAHRVLRTLEFSELEPHVVDEKLYAPGVGIAVERTLAGGKEFWELVRVTG